MQWNTNPAMKDLLDRLAREPDKTPLPITGEELHRLLFPPFCPVRGLCDPCRRTCFCVGCRV